MLVKVDDGRIGPFFGVRNGHGSANATIAARDERDLVQEFAASTVRRAFTFRSRPHVGFQPWLS